MKFYHLTAGFGVPFGVRFGLQFRAGFRKNSFSFVFDAVGATKHPYTFMNMSNYARQATRTAVDHSTYLQTRKNIEKTRRAPGPGSLGTLGQPRFLHFFRDFFAFFCLFMY